MYRKFLLLLFFVVQVWADLPNELPAKEEIENAVKTKCEQNGGADAFVNLKNSREHFQTCLRTHVNETVFREELEEAKKTGSMDEVFGKYCAKTPEIKHCVKNLTASIYPCLGSTEKEGFNLTLDVAKRVGEFLCQHDGDRLAMFIAEGGVDCWNSQIEPVKQCVNTTLADKLPTDISLNSLPSLTINTEKCDDLKNLQKCVVDVLEKCENSTPANLVDALFKFVHRNVCKNRQRRASRNLIGDNNDTSEESSEEKKQPV